MSRDRPWKAEADVFLVTRPADEFVEAMMSAAHELVLDSTDPACRFYTQVRDVDAPNGRAVVVTDIAEYASSGAKKSAVVVSALIEQAGAGESTLTIRTHLEDQLTRFEGDVIVFDDHHDAIRTALMAAVLEIEPAAAHNERPDQPNDLAPAGPETSVVRRHFSTATEPQDSTSRFDLRSVAGMGLLTVGVLVLMVAVASGSWVLIFGALAVTGVLGWAGSRIAGV